MLYVLFFNGTKQKYVESLLFGNEWVKATINENGTRTEREFILKNIMEVGEDKHW